MATLILTAVGTALGGPVGGAIGAIVGQQFDQRAFGPKARHGPRLGELAVQTSSYGTAIPRIFGTMRIAGTVIWSTDLIESSATSGGGKGGPKSVSYSYAASFAVALSARRIGAIRRIWADGKLLRGAAGDFKTRTGWRLYSGDEDQEPDPLIASAEGVGQAPAFRGLAYALFEDFQLADYGNRIPSLTFEVEADPGEVSIGLIAQELGGGAVQAGATPALCGYAASGDSVRGALEALTDVVPLSLTDDGAALRLAAGGGIPILLAGEEESGRREIVRKGSGTAPGEVSIAYHDPGRDFQTGLQRAARGAAQPARNADRLALPAALQADQAKALAESRLASLWAGRSTAKLRLGWRRAAVRPGAYIRLADETGLWKVQRWVLGPMAVTLDLVGVPGSAALEPAPASPGRQVSQPDLPHGPTSIRIHDLPLGEPAGGRPLLFAAAAGVEGSWRRAELMTSFDGGASWEGAGRTAKPAIMGITLGALPPRGSALFDAISVLEVELLNDSMWLEGRSDDGLAAGANLALAGRELIQFGAVAPLGGSRFRLSRLLRGRRGTEWAAEGHQAGEGFTLLDRESQAIIEAPAGALGGEARITAVGVGDETASAAATPIEGASLQPPSPVHLTASREAGGDIAIGWVRRSRHAWSWLDGGDAPIGEEQERYRLAISGDGFARTILLDAPGYLYTAGEQAEDGAAGAMQIAVRQIGSFAVSRPAAILLA